MRRSLLHFSKSDRLSIAGYAGIFVFLFSVSTALSAQVDVTASGGTLMASYTTLKGAFDAINAGTHTGTIAISLTASTTETATAALNASGSGSASYTSVSIQPSVPVTVAGNIAGAIIKLNGADNVSIDGRIGGAGRNLTVQNTSTTASSAAIWLSSLGVGAGSANNIVRNCEIQCGITQNTSTSATYGIIMNGTTISTTSNGADNDNNQFVDNRIIRVRYGIVTRGESASNLNQNTVITDNIVGSGAFGTDQIGKVGILAQFENGCLVSRNTVQFVGGDFANTTSGADRIGIGFGGESWSTTPSNLTNTNFTVTRNIIHDVIEERTFSSVGIASTTTNGGSATNNLIANNIIYNVRSNGTAGDQGVGIGISGGDNDKVVYNSIRMTGDIDPGSASSSSVSNCGVRIATTTPTNLTLRNNIIYVDLTSNTATLLHYCIVAPATTYAWGTGALNNNDYYLLGMS